MHLRPRLTLALATIIAGAAVGLGRRGDDPRTVAEVRFPHNAELLRAEARIAASPATLRSMAADPQLAQAAPTWAKSFTDASGAIQSEAVYRDLAHRFQSQADAESGTLRLTLALPNSEEASAILLKLEHDAVNRWQSSRSDTRIRLTRTITDIDTRISQLQTRRSRMIQEDNLETLEPEQSSVAVTLAEVCRQTLTAQTDLALARDTHPVREGEPEPAELKALSTRLSTLEATMGQPVR